MKRSSGQWRRGIVGRRLTIGIVMFLGGEVCLYLLWPLLDDNDAPPTAEDQLAIAAALMLFGLPHLIAWLARRRHPRLLAIAGASGILLTLISVAGHSLIFFTVPFVLIPSVFYLARGLTRQPPAATLAGSIGVVSVLVVGAAAAFFLTEDPRCSISVRLGSEVVHTQPTVCNASNSGRLGGRIVGASATSDTIAPHESLLSLSLSGLAIVWCMRTGNEAPPTPTATSPVKVRT